MTIEQFTLNNTTNQLVILFEDDFEEQLSYEFLRVLAPSQPAKNQQAPSLTSHKKNIQINLIESVGRHGYRFIFNDDFKVIYSFTRLRELCHNKENLWAQYLEQMEQQQLSREPLIDIIEVK